MEIKMPLKNWIKYHCVLFELFLRRTYRRSKICLRFLNPIFWLFIPWVALIFAICLFENKSFVCVLYEAKYDVFTSIVLAAVSVLTIKIPQYKMYMNRRYSLEHDLDTAIYSLKKIFEKEEMDIVELSNEIDNLKEIHEKVKQLRIESEAFINEQERKEFKRLAERFFFEILTFESNLLLKNQGPEIMLSVITGLDEYLNFPWTRDRDIQRRILRIVKDYCHEWDQMSEFYIFADEEEFKCN